MDGRIEKPQVITTTDGPKKSSNGKLVKNLGKFKPGAPNLDKNRKLVIPMVPIPLATNSKEVVLPLQEATTSLNTPFMSSSETVPETLPKSSEYFTRQILLLFNVTPTVFYHHKEDPTSIHLGYF
jgi:hypothetical protein